MLHLKVVVNAKPVEKLSMTAEATGVKKIAVTFNKAVDTTATKIVVKKGSATPTIASTTFASDAKSAEIVMGTKLTEGTYTVEATVGEEKFTADIAVKNETMTAFELVSKNLVASPEGTTKATISYKAVNQYGEMMAPGNVQATCSFGTDVTWTTPTADKVGTVTVDNINTALAIVGTTGTLVLVDTTNGINLNETITYQSKAIASAATVEGIYSTKTEKLVDGNLKANSKTGDYWILMNVQNQYGDDMGVSAVADSQSDLTFNPASVLTNLTIADKVAKIDKNTNNTEFYKDITYNGKTCILVKLAVPGATKDDSNATNGTIKKAGTLNLTIVSASKGVLANPSFTVDDVVTIANISIAPADTVYANTENKLVVDATDVNGNAITKYDDLDAAIDASSNKGTIILKKNADGTGTYYYKPNSLEPQAASKYKNTTIDTILFNVNDNTSSNYMVKTVNVTVNADKTPWKVSGITNDTVTAVASGSALTFDLSTLNYEDQYGNTIKYSDVDGGKITYDIADRTDNSILTATEENDAVSGKLKKLKIENTAKKGTANLYLLYNSGENGKATQASKDNYDIKVAISVVDSYTVTASDLTLKINDGKSIYGKDTIEFVNATSNSSQSKEGTFVTTGAAVVVTGKIGGKNIVIPKSQFTVTSGTVGNYGKPGENGAVEKTETKTVTVVVDSENGPQILSADVTVSNAGSKATKIEKANDAKADATGTTVSTANLKNTVKITDQYGLVMTGDVVMTVTPTGDYASDLTVTKNATQIVTVSRTGNKKAPDANGKYSYTASVKYEFGGLTFTQDVTLKF